MKSILSQDPEQGLDAATTRTRPEQPAPGNPEYLSSVEEEQFEQQLELDRQRMLDEDARRQNALWEGRP